MRPTGLPPPLPLGVSATGPIGGHVQGQGQTHGAPGRTSLLPEMMGSNNNSTLGVSGLPLSSSRSPPPPRPSTIPMSYPVNPNANFQPGYEYNQYPYPSQQYSGVHQPQQQQYGVQGYPGSVIPPSGPGPGSGPGPQIQGTSGRGTGSEFSDGRNTIPFPGSTDSQVQAEVQPQLIPGTGSGAGSRSSYPVNPSTNGTQHGASVSSYVPLEPSGVPISGPGPGLNTSSGIGIAPRARSHPHPQHHPHPYHQPLQSSQTQPQTQTQTQTSISPQVYVPNQSQDLPQSSGGGQKRGRVQSRGGSVVSVASSGSRGSGLGAGVDVPRVGGVRCCTFFFFRCCPRDKCPKLTPANLALHRVLFVFTFGRLGDVETTLPFIGVRDPPRFGLYTFFRFFPVYVYPFGVTFTRTHSELQLQLQLHP